MEMQYFKEYSPELGRDMECKLYGHAGLSLIHIFWAALPPRSACSPPAASCWKSGR